MADLFWLSDGQWAVLEPFMPTNRPGAHPGHKRACARGRRPARVVRHPARAHLGLSLARLPGRLRPAHDRLQPVQPLVAARLLARHAGGAGRGGLGGRDGGAGQHLRARAPLGARGQRGAEAQAIGPSRGGQTTKVHVLADVLGRPCVVHLTLGNASDVRTAPEVIGAAPGRLKRLIADRQLQHVTAKCPDSHAKTRQIRRRPQCSSRLE